MTNMAVSFVFLSIKATFKICKQNDYLSNLKFVRQVDLVKVILSAVDYKIIISQDVVVDKVIKVGEAVVEVVVEAGEVEAVIKTHQDMVIKELEDIIKVMVTIKDIIRDTTHRAIKEVMVIRAAMGIKVATVTKEAMVTKETMATVKVAMVIIKANNNKAMVETQGTEGATNNNLTTAGDIIKVM